MSLLYVVKAKRNPQNAAAGEKYYLQSKIRGHKSHKAMLNAASKNTTINPKEIDVAVSVWLDALKSALADGFSVEVEGFGTFSTSIKSEGSASESEATPAKLKSISLAFRPKPEMYYEVNKFTMEKYTPDGTL